MKRPAGNLARSGVHNTKQGLLSPAHSFHGASPWCPPNYDLALILEEACLAWAPCVRGPGFGGGHAGASLPVCHWL